MKYLILIIVTLPISSLAQGIWDNLDGHLGALARENLDIDREPAAIDLTGTWGIVMNTWKFLPPEGLKPEFQDMYQRSLQARDDGLVFNNDVGLCWPPGLPMMMNRVWPLSFIQTPTSLIVISNFMNQVRWIFLDGRDHSDPDFYVPSYNGESIGDWHDDSLVVESLNFEASHHWITDGIPATESLRIIEKFTLNENGNELSIEYTMTDPNVWEGEWVSTKHYRREEKVDFLEVHCLPDLNDGIISTNEKYRVKE